MTIYEEMKAAGVEIDNWRSDLHVPVTSKTTAIVKRYEFRKNVDTFQDDEGRLWYDIPFAFDPFWKARAEA